LRNADVSGLFIKADCHTGPLLGHATQIVTALGKTLYIGELNSRYISQDLA